MSKVAWFVVGAAAGAYVTHRVQQAVRPYTPAGWVEQAEQTVRGVVGFVADVREAMNEREAQLHGTLGLLDAAGPQASLPGGDAGGADAGQGSPGAVGSFSGLDSHGGAGLNGGTHRGEQVRRQGR